MADDDIRVKVLAEARRRLEGIPRYKPVNGSSGAVEHRARAIITSQGRLISRDRALQELDRLAEELA